MARLQAVVLHSELSDATIAVYGMRLNSTVTGECCRAAREANFHREIAGTTRRGGRGGGRGGVRHMSTCA